MGYQVGAICYSSDVAATQAIASQEVGKVVDAGQVVYVVNTAVSSAGRITYTLSPIDENYASIESLIPVELQPCGLLEWEDGITLGWGIAAAWVLAYAVLHIRKAAHA